MAVFGDTVEELPGGSGGGLGELSRGIFTFLLMNNCRKSVGHDGDGREEGPGEVGREWKNKRESTKKDFRQGSMGDWSSGHVRWVEVSK